MNDRKRQASSQRMSGLQSEDVVTRPRSIEKLVESSLQGVLDEALIIKALDRLSAAIDLMPPDLKPTLWILDVQRIIRFNTLNYGDPAGKLFNYVAENIGKQIILVIDERTDSTQSIVMNATSLALGRLKIHLAKSTVDAEGIVAALRSIE